MAHVNRQLQARQTSTRIAATAARLFAERGYQGTPMDAIAAEAGVAVQTVYFSFRTKPELLIASYDQAVLGSLDAPHPGQQDWFLRALAEKDATQTLRQFVDGVLGIMIRSGPLHPVMMSAPDEEVRRAFRDRQNGRYEDYRRVVQVLMLNGSVKPELDERRATDLLYAVLSPQLHGILCVERGWGSEQVSAWAVAVLEAQLLQSPAPAPRS
jgi:AcrR family transcriptional regulator